MNRALCIPLAIVVPLLTASTLALVPNPTVTWKVLTPTVRAKPGQVVSVRIQASIDEGYRLYSLRPILDGEIGPTPTEIRIARSASLSIGEGITTSTKPLTKFDPSFRIETEYWDRTVTFTVPVKVARQTKAGEKHEGEVDVFFMTCNDEHCFPPIDAKLPFTVEVVRR